MKRDINIQVSAPKDLPQWAISIVQEHMNKASNDLKNALNKEQSRRKRESEARKTGIMFSIQWKDKNEGVHDVLTMSDRYLANVDGWLEIHKFPKASAVIETIMLIRQTPPSMRRSVYPLINDVLEDYASQPEINNLKVTRL